MTAPPNHPDPIYAGFSRPFERNPTTRVPTQHHRGGESGHSTELAPHHYSHRYFTIYFINFAHSNSNYFSRTAFTEWENYWGKENRKWSPAPHPALISWPFEDLIDSIKALSESLFRFRPWLVRPPCNWCSPPPGPWDQQTATPSFFTLISNSW